LKKEENILKEDGNDSMVKNYKIVTRDWIENIHSKNQKRENMVCLKLMHWNILAQRLADNFDKIPDDSPILYYKNRIELMK